MASKLSKYYKSEAVRHYTRVVAFAVVAAIFAWLVFYGAYQRGYIALHDEMPLVQEVVEETQVAYALTASEPVRLRVPAIDLDTTFEGPMGVNQDRTIEVPDSYEEVGWYKYGPTPGELGPAVILGHVDSYMGPAVFFSLGQLKEGDEIFVDRADGTTATFIVDQLEKHDQTDFPTKQVYSDLDYAGLRLITCTGVYNHGTLRYSHNLIVFAKLVEPTE